jgi:hypothetical protein
VDCDHQKHFKLDGNSARDESYDFVGGLIGIRDAPRAVKKTSQILMNILEILVTVIADL